MLLFSTIHASLSLLSWPLSAGDQYCCINNKNTKNEHNEFANTIDKNLHIQCINYWGVKAGNKCANKSNENALTLQNNSHLLVR